MLLLVQVHLTKQLYLQHRHLLHDLELPSVSREKKGLEVQSSFHHKVDGQFITSELHVNDKPVRGPQCH